jgi:uncharacterized protein (TIRG00374 family)
MRKRAARWFVELGKYVLGFGILAAVIYRYWEANAHDNSPGVRELLQRPVAWEWLLMCLVLLVGIFWLVVVRWYLLVRSVSIPFTLRRAFELGLLGLFGNTFLPGAVGGDFLKAYFLAKQTPGQRTAAVSTVIVDRAFGLFGLILFTAVVGSIAWASGNTRMLANGYLQWMVIVTALIAGSGVVGFLLLGVLSQRSAARFADWLRTHPKIGTVLGEFWQAGWEFRQHMRAMGYGVALTAIAHVLYIFAFYAAGRVFPAPDADMPALAELVIIAPVGFVIQAVPLAPGGVGVGEAAFAGLYRLVNRPESQGVITRLAMRIAEWILALVAWIIYFRMRKTALRDANEAERPRISEAVRPGSN